MLDQTFHDRMRAARIVADLRSQKSRGDIGRLLGIDNTYVSFIEHKTKQINRNDVYAAP